MTACVAGEGAESLVPASHLLVPLVVGFAAAISGLVAGTFPSYVNRGTQAVLGVMIGALLSPVALRQTAAMAVPLAIVTVATVALSLAAAALLALVARLDRATALLGMLAGGSAAAVACAEDMRADARRTSVGFAPSGALRSALLTVIGLDVGLRFTRSALTRLGRLLPLALACSVAVSGACALLAWALSTLVHIPLTDAYLATTPGGINAVIATAAASHADIPLISSVQSLRMFCMVLLVPLLFRLAARWQDRPARGALTAPLTEGRRPEPAQPREACLCE